MVTSRTTTTDDGIPDESPASVLCISGSGRSGTTILSVLLSQHPRIFNLGQYRDFWRAYASQAPCTCSNELDRCEIWGSVVKAGFGNWRADEFDAAHESMRLFIADAAQLKEWGDSEALDNLRHRHRDYLETTANFIRHVQVATGCNVFVDTSKSPEVALAYSMLEGTSIKVLNLVRDPRAVACSWAKKLGDPAKAERYCKMWVERQRVLKSWGRTLGNRYRVLGFERFANRPRPSLSEIVSWLGLDAGPGCFTGEREAVVSWERQHLFPPANEVVLAEKRTTVMIKVPDAWKSRDNWRIHKDALKHTFPEGLQHILWSAFTK